MPRTHWVLQGREFGNCNCDFGCPCQFNAMPTHGDCRAVTAAQVDRGHFGDVALDGLNVVGLYTWPGAVHQSNGTMQLIIDERANTAQREGLLKILTGAETDDMATMWWIFAAMSPTKLEPLFRPIDLQIDVDARRATLAIEGVVETSIQPIRNATTGAEIRARIDLPNGFEFRLAEVASGTTKTAGAIKLEFAGTHSHLVKLHIGDAGVIA